MPFKSSKQRRYMHWAANKGKIAQSVVDKFEDETKKAKKEKYSKLKRMMKK